MKFLPIVAVVCISLTIAKDLDKGFTETVVKDTKDTREDIKKKADHKSLEVHTCLKLLGPLDLFKF